MQATRCWVLSVALSFVATSMSCTLPDMGKTFTVKGAQNSFLWDDGRYNFTVYADDEPYGYVVEDVWLSDLRDDGNKLTTGGRETLVWFGPHGDKLATFQRVDRPFSWFAFLSPFHEGGGSDYADFSEGVLITGCDNEPLFFAGYVDKLSDSWFTRHTYGHFRVLPFDYQEDSGSISMAVTTESGVQEGWMWNSADDNVPGGGARHTFNVMQDEVKLSGKCTDSDPAYCFKLAAKGYCGSSYLPWVGDKKSACDMESSVAECCSLSCAKEIPSCIENSVLSEDPVAILSMKGSQTGDEDTWTVTRNETTGPGTDPRVLIALVTMKTSGELLCDASGYNCNTASRGSANRYAAFYFGSGGMAILALCAGICTCNFLQARKPRGA